MVMLSPGVKTRELDFSAYIPQISTTIYALVGSATKGEAGKPTFISSQGALDEIFGEALDSNYGLIAASQFLSKGNQLYYTRVLGTGAAAASVIAKDNQATPADLLEFTAKSEGTWYNGKVAVIISNIDTTNKTFDVKAVLTKKDGTETSTEYLAVSVDATKDSYILKVMATDKIVNVDDLGDGVSSNLPAAGTYTLANGSDGVALTKGDVSDAINKAYSNTDTLMINLIAAPGFSEASVVSTLLALGENRGDAMAIIDPPIGLKPSEVVDWHNGVLTGTDYPAAALNSSYGALYWSWVKALNPGTGNEIWTPPSGIVGATFAYNDSVAEAWYAPAGLRRGKLSNVLDIEYSPDGGERDLLYGNKNAVNPIVNFAQDGLTVWGQRTLQRMPSATDRVNVRRLMLMSRRAVALSTAYMTFEQNDEYTWSEWKNMVEPFFESIKSRRGLYDYKVIMDGSTVTDTNIDAGEMPGKVLLKPTKSAEFIPIDFTLVSTGAKFS